MLASYGYNRVLSALYSTVSTGSVRQLIIVLILGICKAQHKRQCDKNVRRVLSMIHEDQSRSPNNGAKHATSASPRLTGAQAQSSLLNPRLGG